MAEIVFSSFWTWLGTIALIVACGFSLSMPIYWFTYLKKIMFLHKIHNKRTKNLSSKKEDYYYK